MDSTERWTENFYRNYRRCRSRKISSFRYLATKPDTRVMLADEIAHELMEPGTDCYDRI